MQCTITYTPFYLKNGVLLLTMVMVCVLVPEWCRGGPQAASHTATINNITPNST